MEKSNEEEIKKAYAELQLLNQQFQQIYQNLSLIEKQIIDLNLLKENIIELKSIKKGTPLFVPLGSGVYIKSTFDENSEILVNVGSDTLVKKDIPESKRVIEQQIEKLTKIFNQMETELNNIAVNMQRLQEELNEII